MPRVRTKQFDRQRLCTAIDESGLTRTEVAARAGVSASRVHSAICGRRIGRLAALAIARALRARLDDLLAEPAAAQRTSEAVA